MMDDKELIVANIRDLASAALDYTGADGYDNKKKLSAVLLSLDMWAGRLEELTETEERKNRK